MSILASMLKTEWWTELSISALKVNVKSMMMEGQKQEVRFKSLIVRTVVSVVCLLADLASVIYNTIVIKYKG